MHWRTQERARVERAGDGRWNHDREQQSKIQGHHNGAQAQNQRPTDEDEKESAEALEVEHGEGAAPAVIELHTAAAKEIPPL